MVVAKIVGNVVLACAHPSALRNALFLCQPLDENGAEISDPIVAISPFGGGIGSRHRGRSCAQLFDSAEKTKEG